MSESRLHWVTGIGPHRLALMPRPRGGERLPEEVAAWRQANVGSVLSLLQAQEAREFGLDAEASLCAEYGIDFRSYPIADAGVPASKRELSSVLTPLRDELVRGKAVAVHCRAGIGRTGLVAACLLHLLDVPHADVFHLLSRSRGFAVPETIAQAEWFDRFVRA
jgi:protein-tyrosine phosphatase